MSGVSGGGGDGGVGVVGVWEQMGEPSGGGRRSRGDETKRGGGASWKALWERSERVCVPMRVFERLACRASGASGRCSRGSADAALLKKTLVSGVQTSI